MKNSQKVIHAIGRFFLKLSRFFFDRTTLACWCCGDLVGMRSNYTDGHMWCEPCFQRYIAPRRYAAEQSVQADGATPCAHDFAVTDDVFDYCIHCGEKRPAANA